MDLSAYLDFNVTLDFKQGKILVQDSSQYPAGVASGIIGVITTVQPDSITRNGDYNNPDVTYYNGALLQGAVELRKRSDGLPQQGNYTVTYQVDCPGFTPTTKTKTFNLAYRGITPVITQNFDVFTPNLSVVDNTSYEYAGFASPSVQRGWLAVITGVSQVGGNNQTLDLAYGGSYYDAQYQITLAVDLTYQHSVYSFLKVVDYRFTTLNTSANTPPSYTTLVGYLKIIKANLDATQSQDVEALKDDYSYASAELQQIKQRICSGDTMNLYPQIQDFLNVYHNHITVAYVNTLQPIPTYNYNDVDCGGGSSTTTDSRISATNINNWNAAFLAIPPDDLEVRVGTDAGAPPIGTSTWQNEAFAGWRVKFHLNRGKQSTVQYQADIFYSKPKASDTLTINGYVWTQGDLLQIEFY